MLDAATVVETIQSVFAPTEPLSLTGDAAIQHLFPHILGRIQNTGCPGLNPNPSAIPVCKSAQAKLKSSPFLQPSPYPLEAGTGHRNSSQPASLLYRARDMREPSSSTRRRVPSSKLGHMLARSRPW